MIKYFNMQSVEKVFLTITLFFGLIFAFINPPFQSPDEHEHLAKMFGYTNGVLRYQKLNHKCGLILPESLLKLKNFYAPLQSNVYASTSISVHKQALKLSLDPEKTVFVYHYPPSYLPISYFPIFIFLKIFVLLKLPPLIILYLLRITELFLYTGLMWYAIRITPVKKWLFAFLGMLPMAVYIASSINTDALVIPLCFIFSAYTFKFAYEDSIKTITLKHLSILSVLLFVITICKLAYLPLCLLFFVIPKEKFSGIFHRAKYSCLLFASGFFAFALFMWYGMSNFSGAIASSAISMSESSSNLLTHILFHPVFYLERIWTTASHLYYEYLSSFIGCFGWLDTFLPSLMVKLYLLFLLFAAVVDTNKENKIKLSDKFIFFIIFIISFVVIFLSGFLTFKKLYPYIIGIQGRYFLPLAPVIFLIFSNNKFKITEKNLQMFVAGFSFAGLFISAYFIILRFYMTSYVQLWY